MQKSAKFLSESLKKAKKQYLSKLNVKEAADNKLFCKNVKPYFSDKSSDSTKITLVEKDMVMTDEKQLPILLMSILLALQKI